MMIVKLARAPPLGEDHFLFYVPILLSALWPSGWKDGTQKAVLPVLTQNLALHSVSLMIMKYVLAHTTGPANKVFPRLHDFPLGPVGNHAT